MRSMYDKTRVRVIERISDEMHITPDDFIRVVCDAAISQLAEKQPVFKKILDDCQVA